MNKFLLISLVLLATNIQIFAQEDQKMRQKHEFAVGLLVGAHTLDYDLAVGKSSNPISGGIGFGYTYFFKKNIGIGTGLDLAFYNTKLKYADFSGEHMAFDHFVQEDFEFRYRLQNYEETQNAFYVNVPIMLHYQFAEGEQVSFYAAGGAKIGVPISGKYKSKGADLKTQGYFDSDNSTWTSPEFRGFGNFVTKKQNSELKYKMAFSVALEVGAKWHLPNDLSVYTGVYLDYGLNDIKQSTKEDLSFVEYNEMSPEDHIFNGVVKSSYLSEDKGVKNMVDKINLMAYGIKIRLAFGK